MTSAFCHEDYRKAVPVLLGMYRSSTQKLVKGNIAYSWVRHDILYISSFWIYTIFDLWNWSTVSFPGKDSS